MLAHYSWGFVLGEHSENIPRAATKGPVPTRCQNPSPVARHLPKPVTGSQAFRPRSAHNSNLPSSTINLPSCQVFFPSAVPPPLPMPMTLHHPRAASAVRLCMSHVGLIVGPYVIDSCLSPTAWYGWITTTALFTCPTFCHPISSKVWMTMYCPWCQP